MPGLPGLNGLDGIPGINGTDGVDGVNGDRGPKVSSVYVYPRSYHVSILNVIFSHLHKFLYREKWEIRE